MPPWTNKCPLSAYLSEERLYDLDTQDIGIGIDPGVDFGITLFPWEGKVLSFHGKITHDKSKERVCEVMDVAWDFMMTFFGDRNLTPAHKRTMVIEGPSFGDQYGQVALAENRAGFIAEIRHQFATNCVRLAPKSIRKMAFGSAKITGQQLWPNIDKNAADSIPMALLAFRLQLERRI